MTDKEWLTNRLIEQGYLTENGLGRKAQLRKHHCGQHILTGLDADMAAITVQVDPYAITAHGEVEALRAGRRTYSLHQRRLDPRNRWNIPGHPPGADRVVLPAHDCQLGVPESWRAPPSPARNRREHIPDTPLF